MENKNADKIAALRQAADWLDENPELPSLYVSCIGVFMKGKDQKLEVAIVARAMGKAEKSYLDTTLYLTKSFGSATISYVADRNEVCDQVLVGTRIEPAHVIPAREEQHVPEHEVPVYEWRCSPLLEPDKDSAASAA
jgi:hypothetical protein